MISSKRFRLTLQILLLSSTTVFAQDYLQYEYGNNSRECGYPNYTVDMNKIYETAKKYPNPKILLVTPEERRKVEDEIKLWNEQGKKPRKGMDPCSTCSQEYAACIVFDYLDANVRNCSNWEEWRNDWDKQVHALIDETIQEYAALDLNSYTLNFKLRIGPDGKVISQSPPKGTWQTPDQNSGPYTNQDMADFAKNGPTTLSDMSKYMQDKLSKIQACPFPEGSRVAWIERLPVLYHNVKGQMGHKPSPIPKEPSP